MTFLDQLRQHPDDPNAIEAIRTAEDNSWQTKPLTPASRTRRYALLLVLALAACAAIPAFADVAAAPEEPCFLTQEAADGWADFVAGNPTLRATGLMQPPAGDVYADTSGNSTVVVWPDLPDTVRPPVWPELPDTPEPDTPEPEVPSAPLGGALGYLLASAFCFVYVAWLKFAGVA